MMKNNQLENEIDNENNNNDINYCYEYDGIRIEKIEEDLPMVYYSKLDKNGNVKKYNKQLFYDGTIVFLDISFLLAFVLIDISLLLGIITKQYIEDSLRFILLIIFFLLFMILVIDLAYKLKQIIKIRAMVNQIKPQSGSALKMIQIILAAVLTDLFILQIFVGQLEHLFGDLRFLHLFYVNDNALGYFGVALILIILIIAIIRVEQANKNEPKK